jgi:hypothetical protein
MFFLTDPSRNVSFCTPVQHQDLERLMQVWQCYFFYCADMKVTKNISTFLMFSVLSESYVQNLLYLQLTVY